MLKYINMHVLFVVLVTKCLGGDYVICLCPCLFSFLIVSYVTNSVLVVYCVLLRRANVFFFLIGFILVCLLCPNEYL